jgi:hypothetical protein
VELGRIDILTEVSMLSSHLCLPREGHLEAVYHLFAYLALNHNARVVFDPTFINTAWKAMYRDVKEAVPINAPTPLDKEVDLYHVARELAAMGECIMQHVCSENNPADSCTKIVPTGQKRHHIMLDCYFMNDLAD